MLSTAKPFGLSTKFDMTVSNDKRQSLHEHFISNNKMWHSATPCWSLVLSLASRNSLLKTTFYDENLFEFDSNTSPLSIFLLEKSISLRALLHVLTDGIWIILNVCWLLALSVCCSFLASSPCWCLLASLLALLRWGSTVFAYTDGSERRALQLFTSFFTTWGLGCWDKSW